ncbi:hypothetical protein B0H10DRAFT_1959962 [Mycena sp. CBHHK59/15]|nr:hypothetical protein B0H10DRAFT_1959962 [Mycena sp. CBHHK59/15]
MIVKQHLKLAHTLAAMLSLEKIDMRTKVKGQIRSDHQRDGIYKPRKARKNHKSTANLLAVPCYRDLLDDQDDEDPSERGRALVSSREGRRTQTAKCIADTKAEEPEPDEEANYTPRIPARLPAWPKMTLRVLFGGAEKPRARKPPLGEHWEEGVGKSERKRVMGRGPFDGPSELGRTAAGNPRRQPPAAKAKRVEYG